MKQLLQLSIFSVCLLLSSYKGISQDTKELFSIPGLSMNYLLTDDISQTYKSSHFFEEIKSLCGFELLEYQVQNLYNNDKIYLRIENDKVYLFDIVDCVDSQLLMDFSLEVGDTYLQFQTEIEVVSKTIESFFDGLLRRKIVFNNGREWIEGIGDSFGLINYFLSYETFVCSKINQEVLYITSNSNVAFFCPTLGCRTMEILPAYEQQDTEVQLINRSRNHDFYSWTMPDGEIFQNSSPDFILDEKACFRPLLSINNFCGDGPILEYLNVDYCQDSIWVKRSNDLGISHIKFFDESTGLAISEDKIFKTYNGGLDWVVKPFYNGSTNGPMFALDINKNGEAIIGFSQLGSGNGESIMMSYDEGESWNKEVVNDFIFRAIITDDNQCFAFRPYSSDFFYSNDSGKNWSRKPQPDEYRVERFEYVESILFGLGHKLNFPQSTFTISRSEDSGTSWQHFEFDGYRGSDFQAIDMVTKDLGYLGGQGFIFKTVNSWQDYEYIKLNSFSMIIDLEFVDENIGWAVTAIGEIFKTYDGGLNWEKEYCLNTIPAVDLDAIDESSAFLILENTGTFHFAPEEIDCLTSTKEINYFEEIELYPNPTRGRLSYSLSNKLYHMSIIDLQGKVLKQWNSSQLENEIDVSFLENGMYLLQAKSEEGKQFKSTFVIAK